MLTTTNRAELEDLISRYEAGELFAEESTEKEETFASERALI
jgi:hypothetical protein